MARREHDQRLDIWIARVIELIHRNFVLIVVDVAHAANNDALAFLTNIIDEDLIAFFNAHI